MRIFFDCRRVPFPPDRGDKIPTFNQIRHLAERHEVHVFCLGDGTADLDNISGLAQFAEHFPQVPRIMEFGDLDSLKWQQYAGRSRIPLSWLYALEEKRLLAYERDIAHSFSHALVHTAAEKRDFQKLISGVPVGLVGNGVDLDYFRSAGAAKQTGSIVFTGVMDYRPNVDAVVWFCQEILPAVRAVVAKAHFTICGRRPVRAVRGLARLAGVTVTGSVPDTRPYLDRAEVFVASLRIARGLQNKLLEALSMGLPCVTSTAAWSGTAIPNGEGIVATDDPQQFAAHVINLLQDANWRAEMGRRARAITEAKYKWEAQMARLDQVIAAAVSQPQTGSASAWLRCAR